MTASRRWETGNTRARLAAPTSSMPANGQRRDGTDGAIHRRKPRGRATLCAFHGLHRLKAAASFSRMRCRSKTFTGRNVRRAAAIHPFLWKTCRVLPLAQRPRFTSKGRTLGDPHGCGSCVLSRLPRHAHLPRAASGAAGLSPDVSQSPLYILIPKSRRFSSTVHHIPDHGFRGRRVLRPGRN